MQEINLLKGSFLFQGNNAKSKNAFFQNVIICSVEKSKLGVVIVTASFLLFFFSSKPRFRVFVDAAMGDL
jgi:hypothetical protein